MFKSDKKSRCARPYCDPREHVSSCLEMYHFNLSRDGHLNSMYMHRSPDSEVAADKGFSLMIACGFDPYNREYQTAIIDGRRSDTARGLIMSKPKQWSCITPERADNKHLDRVDGRSCHHFHRYQSMVDCSWRVRQQLNWALSIWLPCPGFCAVRIWWKPAYSSMRIYRRSWTANDEWIRVSKANDEVAALQPIHLLIILQRYRWFNTNPRNS